MPSKILILHALSLFSRFKTQFGEKRQENMDVKDMCAMTTDRVNQLVEGCSILTKGLEFESLEMQLC